MVRWRGRKESENVEDRRSEAPGSRFPFPFPRGGGRVRFPFPRGGRVPSPGRTGGIGIIGLLVILGVMFLLGLDPRVIFQKGGLPVPGQETGQTPIEFPGTHTPPASTAGRDDSLKQFVSVILADTEEVWEKLFKERGGTYQYPKLVLFSGFTQTGCGFGQSAMGPFYCPLDQKIYLDMSFFHDLQNQLGAPGDFAQAYVIAHEIGHHVQMLAGITEKVRRAQTLAGGRGANALQVAMELQADCFAGVWAHEAHRIKSILEEGDIEEGLRAASAVGDDRIQKRTQGRVVPDSFTHGSSAQRTAWFKRGLESGRLEACATFDGALAP